jgi:germination protein M
LRAWTTIGNMKYAIVALGTILAGLLGVALASCGTGGPGSAGPVPTAGAGTSVPSSDTTPTVLTGGTGTEPSGQKPIRYEVWFHRGEQLFMVTRTSDPTLRVGTAAMEQLLAGPTDPERVEGVQTQIPDGTELLGLTIDKGIARVDLTSEFEAGGGSASMSMRLAQVVYTLTQFPTVKGVRFALDGQTIDVLGGEGVVIDHPLTRKDYAELLPAIVVQSPAIGEAVASPVTVSGNANVFEANVTVLVLDAKGNEIGRTFTTATCGTGCRGTYSTRVPYKVAEDQEGTIVVQDDDAAGTGRPPHVVEIPVQLSAS